MQHVGTLHKFRLYWKMYHALQSVSEPRTGKSMLCDGNKWESEECIEWNQIDHIIYNALPHNTYASNANLRVQVNWAEIYENDHPGLRNEVVRLFT